MPSTSRFGWQSSSSQPDRRRRSRQIGYEGEVIAVKKKTKQKQPQSRVSQPVPASAGPGTSADGASSTNAPPTSGISSSQGVEEAQQWSRASEADHTISPYRVGSGDEFINVWGEADQAGNSNEGS